MKLDKILKEEIVLIRPDKKELAQLRKEAGAFVSLLKEEIKKKKIRVSVFIGGSFAKGTLLRRDSYDVADKPQNLFCGKTLTLCAVSPQYHKNLPKKSFYDVDIFVRFDLKIGSISSVLEELINSIKKKEGINAKKVHGSRDYFQLKKGKAILEIIPVYKIKKPKEARNVTDLSYFHVSYVKKKMKKKMLDEVLLAKQFCHAQKIYGAESYIQGFSGYGLECLIIHYKSFLKMLKGLSKELLIKPRKSKGLQANSSKVKEKLVIDPEKHYKKAGEALLFLNESRRQSPIILIDPIWKERNVLAALSRESFERFQKSAGEFLKAPSKRAFEEEKFSEEKFRQKAEEKGCEFVHLKLKTDRQEGDIAGTKMKKFSRFIKSKLSRFFEILASEFLYSRGKESEFYIAAKSRGEIVIRGPPMKMKRDTEAFRARHVNISEKDGILYARESVNFSAKEFLEEFSRNEGRIISEMGIQRIRVI